MEEEKIEEKKNVCEEIICETEKLMEEVLENGIDSDSIEFLGEVVDIHKDLKNEKYWEEKIMRYRESYGRYYRDGDNYGRGGYREVETRRADRYRDSYGRRGYDAKYRGDNYMGDMMDYYHEYRDGRENYGNDDETMKSFKYMLKSFKDYYKHLKDEAGSQDEIRMLEDTAREIVNM